MTTTELDLAGLSERGARDLRELIVSGRFDAFADQLVRVNNCARPVTLVGGSQVVDTSTGEILSSYSSADETGGVTRIPCGNRRSSVCPACSRTYAADTWHVIHTGAAGGKGVPDTVATHPMLFATATAPSFGPVHTAHRTPKPCRPRRKKQMCPHGRATWCNHPHEDTDRAVGQPICSDCYDYQSHAIWQWHAPELWRRFTIAANRGLARRVGTRPSRLKDIASIQFAKVGEYQRRGVIHFHALIRLDGPKTPDGITDPPPGVSADDLADIVRAAFAQVNLIAPAVDAADVSRRLSFGRQIDARPIRNTSTNTEDLTASAVAGYIAKYATKTIDDPDSYDPTSAHHRRLRQTVTALANQAAAFYPQDENPYALLGKWDHMLGFRGHFSSKSRRYSTTLGRLRGARRRWQRLAARAKSRDELAELLQADDEDDTTLVIGQWRYVGQGWANEGQVALATAAAARAREHARERAFARTTSRASQRRKSWNGT
jgi:hypothetical protein